jgi:hypothetical protein
LKPEKAESSKKRKAESLLSTEKNLTRIGDEDTSKEYFFIYFIPLSFSMTKLEQSYHPEINQ